MTLNPFVAPPFRGASPPCRRAKAKAQGFTLLELAFYAATAGLILTATSIAIVSSMSSNANLEVFERMQVRLNRVNSLIQSETTEASAVSTTESIPCSATDKSLFTLKIPRPSDPSDSIRIHYYRLGEDSNADLWRCGPSYNDDGSINFDAASVGAPIALRTELAVREPGLNASEAKKIIYELTFYTPEGKKIKLDPAKSDSDTTAYISTATVTVGIPAGTGP